MIELVAPAERHLPSYLDATRRGWSSSAAAEDADAAEADLARIEADPADYLLELNDPMALGRPYVLGDGTPVPRLPGVRRWMWDGEYCGAISLRYEPGSQDLPPYCLGHIGYGVVPWKRRRGYATKALALMLEIAPTVGLTWVDIVTDVENAASQAVIVANGGALVREFTAPGSSGGFPALLYRISM